MYTCHNEIALFTLIKDWVAHKALLDLTSPYLSTITSYNLFPYLLFIPVTEKYFFLFFKDQTCFCFGSCCYSLCLEYFVPPMPYFCMVGFFFFFFILYVFCTSVWPSLTFSLCYQPSLSYHSFKKWHLLLYVMFLKILFTMIYYLCLFVYYLLLLKFKSPRAGSLFVLFPRTVPGT